MPFEINMMIISEFTFLICHAVYKVAQVLHKMVLNKIEIGSPGDAGQPVLLPWLLNIVHIKHIPWTPDAFGGILLKYDMTMLPFQCEQDQINEKMFLFYSWYMYNYYIYLENSAIRELDLKLFLSAKYFLI